MIETLEFGSVLLAILAAGFWLWSATVPFVDVLTFDEMNHLGPKLKTQSKRSAYAALCAAAAATLQAISLLIN